MGKPSKIGAHPGMPILSWLRAALRFGHGVVRNSGGSGITSQCTGSANPIQMSTESILFGRARLTTPTRLGSLFQLTFSVTSRRNCNYDSNTKCNGHRYGSNDSSRCWMHHASDAINSITTQRQLYLTRITVRTSGTVPEEHTVGQTRLMVQLAVGSQRTAFRSERDLL